MEYAQKAEDYSSRLSAPLKLKLKGLLFELAGDLEGAHQTYRLLVDQYPKNTDGLLYLADVAMRIGNLDEARMSLEECTNIEADNPYCYYNLMMLDLRENKFDEVIRSHALLKKSGIEYPWFDLPVGIAFWGKEDVSRAAEHFSQLAVAHSREGAPHRGEYFETGKLWLADLALYQGRLQDARSQIELLLDVVTDQDNRASYIVYLAQIDVLTGDTKKALSHAKSAMTMSTSPETVIQAIIVLATLGDAQGARSAYDSLRSSIGVGTGGRYDSIVNLIDGLIALSEGRPRKAIQALSFVKELTGNVQASFLLGKAHMSAEQWQEATQNFEEVTKSKGIVLIDHVPLIWPLAHHNLGLCYEKLGQREQAIASYSKFLDLWDSADTALGSPTEVRERVSVLSASSPQLETE